MAAADSRPFRRVPSVVGLRFFLGRQEAAAHGLALANPDPDGPSVSALTWPADPVIVAQEPAPGALLRQWESVKVWLQAGPDALAVTQHHPLRVDPAHALPDSPPVEVDLSVQEDERLE